VASGRGLLTAARIAAATRPASFAGSTLAGAAAGDPARITSEALVVAVRAGDAFAIDLLRCALRPLASAVSCVFSAIGIRRHLFIGGFALAIGEQFIALLGDELVRLGCFGLDAQQTRAMLRLGVADDDHSLIGIGQLLARVLVGHISDGSVDAHAHCR
jgi:glucokinase